MRRAPLGTVLVACLLLAAASATSAGFAPPAEGGPPAVPRAPVRVLPLGDSITDGGPTGGYRTPLWQRAQAARCPVDLVGSLRSGPPELGDPDHEGHWGQRIDQVDALAGGRVRAAAPDVVLLHLGTNDLYQGAPAATALVRLDHLLATVLAARPQAVVVVATVVPLALRPGPRAAFNAGLPELVAAHRARGDDVRLADMAPVDPAHLPDGVHPDVRGDATMATVWWPFLGCGE